MHEEFSIQSCWLGFFGVKVHSEVFEAQVLDSS